MNTDIVNSSDLGGFRDFKGSDKVKEICKSIGDERYVNAIGGMSLYDKDDFRTEGIDLRFVKSKLTPYEQLGSEFIPRLSIIDLIFSIDDMSEIKQQLRNYELI